MSFQRAGIDAGMQSRLREMAERHHLGACPCRLRRGVSEKQQAVTQRVTEAGTANE